ncbi:MAG: hypothetical protein HRT56_02125, partial [Coraliomargarita sp.]|nr:hypothetical protein [Coraliomargarita sp.]
NGFNPDVPFDYQQLDTDGDGKLDILEIFQGTDKTSKASAYGLIPQSADSEDKFLKIRYRRSVTNTGVIATYSWSPNLIDWYKGGMDINGVEVDVREEVIETSIDYEIVEATAQITLGDIDHFFIRLDLTPSE